MTEPTRERILAHAKAWEAAAASINNEDSGAAVLAYALRIAANLPSEEELVRMVVIGNGCGLTIDGQRVPCNRIEASGDIPQQQCDCADLTTAILERIRRGE